MIYDLWSINCMSKLGVSLGQNIQNDYFLSMFFKFIKRVPVCLRYKFWFLKLKSQILSSHQPN